LSVEMCWIVDELIEKKGNESKLNKDTPKERIWKVNGLVIQLHKLYKAKSYLVPFYGNSSNDGANSRLKDVDLCDFDIRGQSLW
jgi:hypothetical protein